jgi:hypothetical protein
MLLVVDGERRIGGGEIGDVRIEGRHGCSRVLGKPTGGTLSRPLKNSVFDRTFDVWRSET